MATLTVFKFASPEGAGHMLTKVEALQKMELIKIQDAAIVTWPVGKKSPKTHQADLIEVMAQGAARAKRIILGMPLTYNGIPKR